jgi:hypothetical protein
MKGQFKATREQRPLPTMQQYLLPLLKSFRALAVGEAATVIN